MLCFPYVQILILNAVHILIQEISTIQVLSHKRCIKQRRYDSKDLLKNTAGNKCDEQNKKELSKQQQFKKYTEPQ
jgi:hypothetical protein